LGVERQLLDCRRQAELRGWEIVEKFVDDDRSAWSGKQRPEYERCLDALRSGAIEGLLVWDLDRLHRQPRELEEFISLCEQLRLTNVASASGDIDLTTAEGQFQARILGAVAKKESDDKSRRIRRKHEELAAAGKVSGGGSRPYGYETDKRTIRPAEAAIVRECARRFLAGESIRAIASDLNERGIPTSSGGSWAPQSLRRMLASARIAGQREHRGEVIGKAEWPGIINPTESARIRAKLADPERRTNRSARRYLLTRLLKCGLCGEYLVSRPRSDGQRRYACARGPGFSGCGHLYINADETEAWVLDACFYRLDTPELAAALAGANDNPEAERWQQEIDQAQARLEELAAEYGQGKIGMPEWRLAREPIEQRRTAARRQLAKASRVTVLDGYVGNAAALRAEWDSLDLTRQHAIVAAVVDHVSVAPGRRGYNRFDEARLRPFWRL
jgi:DNA invertase Pin-like site-specific DNA recombinase